MIQRIQTVYFALAGIIALLMFYVNIVNFNTANGYTVSLNACGIYPTEAIEKLSLDSKTLTLTITTAIAGLISIIALFLYNNRPLQIRLARMSIVILGSVMAQNVLYSEEIYKQVRSLGYEKNYAIGFIFPVIAIILLALAHRGVKKDDALVKSVDRLR